MSDKEGNKAKIIGTALKEWIEKSPYTKRDVARMLGVSPQYINGLCQGKPIGKVMANKISNLFGLSEYFLLTGEGFIEQPKEQNELPNSSSIDKNYKLKILESELEMLKRTNAALVATIESKDQVIATKDQLIDYLKRELSIHTNPSDLYVSDDLLNLKDNVSPPDK